MKPRAGPGGPGAGGWGSVATFAHDLYVRNDDLHRAREIVAADADEEISEESDTVGRAFPRAIP